MRRIETEDATGRKAFMAIGAVTPPLSSDDDWLDNASIHSSVRERCHSKRCEWSGPLVMVVAKKGTIRVGVITEDGSVANHLAQQLCSQGISATRITASALGAKGKRPFDVLIVAEPIREVLDQLRGGELGRDLGILVAEKSQRPEIRAGWLEAGANDCISLPATAIELGARMRALGRRLGVHVGAKNVISAGRLELHLRNREAYLQGNRLELTSSEFDLLARLTECAGQVLSREQLLELTTGSVDESFERSIDVRVSRLRAKLGDDPRNPRMLKTVRGQGYLLRGT
jgi:two-component system, OmpR family, response regulator